MLNQYDTPDFRETIVYKGNLAIKPVKIDLNLFDQIEGLLIPDLQITVRCQQIFLFMQMMYFFIVHLLYLLIPRTLIIESSLLYVFSWSVLIVQSFEINIFPNTAKRFPVNLTIFILGSGARVFVYLFICEYFSISKFLLLNLMSLSLLNYIRFKVLQQEYHTYLEMNQQKNPFQLDDTLLSKQEQQVDQDWDLIMSRQEEDLKQLEKNSEEQEDQEVSQEEVDQENEKPQSSIKEEEQKQQPQQQDLPCISIANFMDFKVFLYNYMIGLIIPLLLWVYFNFQIKQLIIVVIFNIIYMTIVWIHCKTYYSDRRIFVLIYNVENAYLLLTSYFDSDILCPWWLIIELLHLRDKNYVRKTRISFG